MREGILDTALCLEDHITELTNKTLFLEDQQYRNETKDDLEKLRFSYGRLYWNLYNSHDRCYDKKRGIQCGSQYHSMHNSMYVDLLSSILVDIYEQLIEYDYIQ
ncbi:MAG: hypothetical protein DYH13_06875 [Alphaproteobacteria bacterium PRO2]|nr:hypothetical protein [Alphaproteobacteria bacterium PRO2]